MVPNLRDYLSQVLAAIHYENGDQLASLLSINLANPDILARVQLPIPSKHDLQVLPDAKWASLVEIYIENLKTALGGDISEWFKLQVRLLESLNRCAEKQENWVLPAMYTVDKELRRFYEARREQRAEQGGELSDNEQFDSLEKMARVISTSFQICLNDRNPEVQNSKRQGVYFFIGELFKIYFRLRKHDLARSTEKAFSSLRNQLPQIDEIMKSHAITYLYFSASISCSGDDLKGAGTKLTRALELCTKEKDQLSQRTSILLLLIPIKFLETRKMPSQKVWQDYPTLKLVYEKLFIAIKQGDLKLFDYEFQKLEKILLKRHLYLVVKRIRTFVILQLFKKAWLALDKKPHIPISVFQISLEYSISHTGSDNSQFRYSLDAAESQVARLIALGYVKGYLSHGNRVAVLSKAGPFPKVTI